MKHIRWNFWRKQLTPEPLTILTVNSVIDIWLGVEHTSVELIFIDFFIDFLLFTYYQAHDLTCVKCYVVVLLGRLQTCLTISCFKLFFNAMFHFYTPWKCQKIFDFINVSWGHRNGALGRNWLCNNFADLIAL